MDDKQTGLQEQKAVFYTIPQEYLHHEEDNIEYSKYINWFKSSWKLIASITILGAILSVAFALYQKKIYHASVKVGLPTFYSVETLNLNGIRNYTRESLFKQFYQDLTSVNKLRSFIVNSEYIDSIFDHEERLQNSTDLLVSDFVESFESKVVEPFVDNQATVEFPSVIEIGLQHHEEALLVQLLNDYTEYVGKLVVEELTQEQVKERETRIQLLQNKIELARGDAINRRQLKIERLTIEIQREIESIEQQKKLLIEKEAADRQKQVMSMEYENNIQLTRLEQKREALLATVKKEREKAIAEAQEARQIAESLGIVSPTRLDELISENGKAVTPNTEIKLADSQSLPLYLMGTKYLDTVISTLQKRENDQSFVVELATVNSSIRQLKEDAALIALKERKNDEDFLKELNELDKKVAELENDTVLAELKARKSDDPFIENLPNLQQEIESLKSATLDFSDVKVHSILKSAFFTNKALKPNRKLIAIVGTLFFFLLACFYSFIRMVWNENDSDNSTLLSSQ